MNSTAATFSLSVGQLFSKPPRRQSPSHSQIALHGLTVVNSLTKVLQRETPMMNGSVLDLFCNLIIYSFRKSKHQSNFRETPSVTKKAILCAVATLCTSP